MSRKQIQTYACLMALAATLVLVSSASAAGLHSTFFNHQYNGDVYPLLGYTENVPDINTWITAPSTDGDILTYQTDILAGGGYWQSDNWGSDVLNATGWTLEFRVRILDDATDDPSYGAFQIFAKDGASVNASRRAILSVGRTFTSLTSRSLTPIDSSDNTSDFHVFRISQPANSSTVTVWRDEVLLFSNTSKTSNNSEGSQLWWGDGSSAVGGPTVMLDYFRFDSTGPFDPAPVPEPSAFALAALGLGGCLLLRRGPKAPSAVG